jgi:hypothetical protein
MADRRVLARLRITPCGLFDQVTRTIVLKQIGSDYFLEVFERERQTKKQSRRCVAVSEVVVRQQLAALKLTTVPAVPVSPMVFDGAYIELTIEGEHSTLTIGWWTTPPDGAEGVAEFADWLSNVGLGREEDHKDENA